MKVIVKENRQLEIINQSSSQNENDVEIIELDVPEKYKDWNKKIVFILPIDNDNIVWDIILDNTYYLTKAITQYKQVQFYIWLTHEEQDFRSIIKTLSFYENKNVSQEITPEEINAINQILAEIDLALQEVDNIDIDINKNGTTTTLILTKKDNTNKIITINDGEKGETGNDGYTPIKGIDYWTNSDKEEIISSLDNNIQEYFNRPFATFSIENGNLIVEVEEYGTI